MERPSVFYNGFDSCKDLGLVITDIKHPSPDKQITRASVPFSNRQPDFSRASGRYTYKQRTLEYTFAFRAKSSEGLELLISRIQNWLLEAPAGDLQESISPDWHFAEVTCDSCLPEYLSETYAQIQAQFTAYPFRIFNFTRPEYYPVSSTLTEQAYELTYGDKENPYFTSESGCLVKVGEQFYEIPAGSERYRLSDIVFLRGTNCFSLMSLGEGSGKLLIECIEERI